MVLVTGKAVTTGASRRRWDKNDDKDAAHIAAHLVSRGRCLYYDYPSSSINELRQLLSLTKALEERGTQPSDADSKQPAGTILSRA